MFLPEASCEGRPYQISVPSIARHPVVHRSIVWAGTSVVNRPMLSFQDRRHKAAPCDKMLVFILLAVRAQQALLMPQHQDGFDHVRADSASRSSLQYRSQELRFCVSGTQSERGQYVGCAMPYPLSCNSSLQLPLPTHGASFTLKFSSLFAGAFGEGPPDRCSRQFCHVSFSLVMIHQCSDGELQPGFSVLVQR